MKLNKFTRYLAIYSGLCGFSVTSQAFYEHSKGDNYVEIRGLTRFAGSMAKYPENNIFYTDSNVSGLSEEARLLVNGGFAQNWRYEINLQQAYVNKSLLVTSSRGGVERSSLAHQSFSNDDVLEVDLDRLNLRWSQGKIDMRLGRQAINLANTFYFTPNDFFAPFSAQTFYRVYKPGVDGLRLDYSSNELTQWSLISVLGYESDSGSDTGWSNSPDYYRTSYLARATTVWKDFQWIAMLGRVREDNIFAASTITGIPCNLLNDPKKTILNFFSSIFTSFCFPSIFFLYNALMYDRIAGSINLMLSPAISAVLASLSIFRQSVAAASMRHI